MTEKDESQSPTRLRIRWWFKRRRGHCRGEGREGQVVASPMNILRMQEMEVRGGVAVAKAVALPRGKVETDAMEWMTDSRT